MDLLQSPLVCIWLGAYLAPLLRLLFFFAHDGFAPLVGLNRLAGRLELYFGWVRDFSAIPLAFWLFWKRVPGWPVAIPLTLLSIYSRWWRWHGLKPLQEFARLNPKVHPKEFFSHLYGRLGFLPHRIPLKAKSVIEPAHLDFRNGKKPRQSFFILLRGLHDLYLFATLAYKAFRWKGAHYLKSAGSGLAAVCSATLAMRARMEVVVEGSPTWALITSGKRIFAVSHKSFFDFCLAPLVYFQENPDGSAASFIPGMMVAKDHFRDNPFLYRIIGLGKMLEAWGMVFVDRKSKKDGTARRAAGLAVKKILASDASFAIYPQGTRALGQWNKDGSRWDAGYFCVGKGKRLKQEMGHFKKGVAYIAVETALSLLKQKLSGPVWILPVGMVGVGTACPKGSWKVQTGTKVILRMGEPIRIDPVSLKEFKASSYRDIAQREEYKARVEEVTHKVDRSLQQLLEVAPRLERRFFTDLNDVLVARGGWDEIAVAFKEWRQEGALIYVILDCIYALPKRLATGFLVELANLLRGACSREDLVGLRNKIAGYF